MFTTTLFGFLTFLTPLFFWTLTPSIFATPKEFIIVAATIVLIGNLVYRLFKGDHIPLSRSPLTLPLVLFMVTITASLIFNPEGRPEALAGKALVLLVLPSLTLLTLTIRDHTRLTRTVTTALLSSTTLLSLHSLLSLSFLYRSAYLPEFMQNIAFTPTGSYLTTLTLILIGLSLAASLLKHDSTAVKNTAAGLIILHTIATVAIVSLMLPGGSLFPSLLSYQASWSIALDALKSLRSLLFGIGLSNYSLLYTTVKPLSINSGPLWNMLPTSSASELLTLLPTAGILSTLSFLVLIAKGIVWSRTTQLAVPFAVASLSFLVLPIALPTYLVFFLLLALIATRHTDPVVLSPTQSRLTAGVLVVASIFILIVSGRSYASEFFVKQSQQALQAGDSQRTYDLYLSAIRYSPQISAYHSSFAEINFRLASALSQKETLNDSERETISQLVQQSVTYSKTAISLRPNSATNWIAIAKIYQNLINVAEGSDKFALEAYTRAIALDRANPALRLEFGNLLSQLAKTQKEDVDKSALLSRAQVEFQTAIQLKSDYVNAYYNLAKLYEAESDYVGAVTAMQQVLKYLDDTSSEHAKASSELDILKSKLPKSTPTPSPLPESTSELTAPSPLPSPIPGGPIELP